MAVREFTGPTRVISGSGAVAERLSAEAAALGADVVAVVSDRGLADAGLLDTLLAHVSGVETVVCGLVGEGPSLAETEAAADAAHRAGAGAVLAIGGGSALGGGRAVAVRLTNHDPLPTYAGRGNVPVRPAPCLAVPTTAGSGSEVSAALVVYDADREQQIVIRGRGVEPDVAIVDGEMLRSLPRAPMIHAGLDALSHALESLWANGASGFTDALAIEAARRIEASLPAALDRDTEAMQQLIEASTMANLACGSAELGLVHALSSSPTIGRPHGYVNAILLPHVARFNAPELRPAASRAIEGLDALYAAVGFTPRFADGEIPADRTAEMVRAAAHNPFRDNNVRATTEGDLTGLLVQAGAEPGP